MDITLTHDHGLKFTTHGNSGYSITTDASSAVGGGDQGFRPMELFLASLVSCTSIDIILILNKSRKPYHGYQVRVEGKRRDEVPKYFTEISMYFSMESEEVLPDVFHRAVSLSLTKYCSVAEMIRPDITIKAYLTLNGRKDERVILKNISDN